MRLCRVQDSSAQTLSPAFFFYKLPIASRRTDQKPTYSSRIISKLVNFHRGRSVQEEEEEEDGSEFEGCVID